MAKGIRSDDYWIDLNVSRIKELQNELTESKWLENFLESLDSILNQSPPPKELRCLALGHVADYLNPRFQLALILILADHLHITRISAWDPQFTGDDRAVLARYSIAIDEHHDFTSQSLYFVPHGPASLTASLVNELSRNPAVYIGNDIRNCSIDIISTICAPNITNVSSDRKSRWFAAFNDLAVHKF